MQQGPKRDARPPDARQTCLRLAAIGAIVLSSGAAFAYVGGWLDPQRLTPDRVVDALEANSGVHAGFRRNHAKGVCVVGQFESSGAAHSLSTAAVFASGNTPVVGRLALPGGNPYASDSSVPIRSFALQFSSLDGEQWRTGMNSMPVFPLATPQAFYEQQLAARPDPKTGKPDPQRMQAFFGAHPETAAFRAWAKTAQPSASYATESYYGLNAFYLVDAQGTRRPVRWQLAPLDAAAAQAAQPQHDADYLQADLEQRLAQGPLRWRLLVTLGAAGDPTSDATRQWPADRTTVDAGIVVITRSVSQEDGPCRDVNYDPTVLPRGIALSDDPLVPARSAAYAASYERRTGEGPPQAAKASSHSTQAERAQ
ncbi:catalase family peroxidase [Achromobacter deleyi]|uniref:catalase family peroxidase n=1 Tax=Achromobacter deleyi TaxID=1353891 RepID=UPI001491B3CD|nr:catalase family peroxidase [Achromobacter deleyi]QVQ25383.1 catalase family peroxidase [Achromobacter deleyi]UIP20925.1 catalase family peroxidase [Achromobacter deleyi]